MLKRLLLLVLAVIMCFAVGACSNNETEKKYTVSFNSGGGVLTGETAVTVSRGKSITLPGVTKVGFDFDGWFNGQTLAGISGAQFTPSADVTLTAKWTEKVVIPDKNAEYAAENLERSIEYAKLIHDEYWNAETQKSTLIPGQGVPFLWPYGEHVGMVNSIVELLDEQHKDYVFFTEYLKQLMEGYRYYRCASVSVGTGEKWENANHTLPAYGVTDGTLNSYAIYQAGRQNNKDSANSSFGGVYFDDNIWVAKEFYNAYKNLGDVKYLNEAINIVNWIIGEGYETTSGMNGIYWNWGAKFKHPGVTDDSKNASLNSCSTAPTGMMLVKLYQVMDEESLAGKFDAIRETYISTAKKVYNFMWSTLREPTNNVFKDKIFVNKLGDNLVLGTLDEQILPYNTGTYMTLGAGLYNVSESAGQTSAANLYKQRNADVAKGSDVFFAGTLAVPGQYTYNQNSWFTSFLLEGFMDILPTDENCATYIEHMRSSLDYGYKNNRDEHGYVSPAWTQGWSVFNDNGVSEGNPKQILLQSANAHCYAMLAKHFQSLV